MFGLKEIEEVRPPEPKKLKTEAEVSETIAIVPCPENSPPEQDRPGPCSDGEDSEREGSDGEDGAYVMTQHDADECVKEHRQPIIESLKSIEVLFLTRDADGARAPRVALTPLVKTCSTLLHIKESDVNNKWTRLKKMVRRPCSAAVP